MLFLHDFEKVKFFLIYFYISDIDANVPLLIYSVYGSIDRKMTLLMLTPETGDPSLHKYEWER